MDLGHVGAEKPKQNVHESTWNGVHGAACLGMAHAHLGTSGTTSSQIILCGYLTCTWYRHVLKTGIQVNEAVEGVSVQGSSVRLKTDFVHNDGQKLS